MSRRDTPSRAPRRLVRNRREPQKPGRARLELYSSHSGEKREEGSEKISIGERETRQVLVTALESRNPNALIQIAQGQFPQEAIPVQFQKEDVEEGIALLESWAPRFQKALEDHQDTPRKVAIIEQAQELMARTLNNLRGQLEHGKRLAKEKSESQEADFENSFEYIEREQRLRIHDPEMNTLLELALTADGDTSTLEEYVDRVTLSERLGQNFRPDEYNVAARNRWSIGALQRGAGKLYDLGDKIYLQEQRSENGPGSEDRRKAYLIARRVSQKIREAATFLREQLDKTTEKRQAAIAADMEGFEAWEREQNKKAAERRAARLAARGLEEPVDRSDGSIPQRVKSEEKRWSVPDPSRAAFRRARAAGPRILRRQRPTEPQTSPDIAERIPQQIQQVESDKFEKRRRLFAAALQEDRPPSQMRNSRVGEGDLAERAFLERTEVPVLKNRGEHLETDEPSEEAYKVCEKCGSTYDRRVEFCFEDGTPAILRDPKKPGQEGHHPKTLERWKKEFGKVPPEYAALKPGERMTQEHLVTILDTKALPENKNGVTKIDIDTFAGVLIEVPGPDGKRVVIHHRFSNEEMEKIISSHHGAPVFIGRRADEKKGEQQPDSSQFIELKETLESAGRGRAKNSLEQYHVGFFMENGQLYAWDQSEVHGVRMLYEKEEQQQKEMPEKEMPEDNTTWARWERNPQGTIRFTETEKEGGAPTVDEIIARIIAMGDDIPEDTASFYSGIIQGNFAKEVSRETIRRTIEKLRAHIFTGNPREQTLATRRAEMYARHLEEKLNPLMSKSRVSIERKRNLARRDIGTLRRNLAQYRNLLERTNASDPENVHFIVSRFGSEVTGDNGLREEFTRIENKRDETGLTDEYVQFIEAYHAWLEDVISVIEKNIQKKER